jgi:hypothetical protein
LTKQHKTVAFYEFLSIKNTLWKTKLIVLVIACCIGFPSTLLSLLRNKLHYEDAVYHNNSIVVIDWWTFYIYMFGIYKDDREDVESYFYLTMFILTICLIIERQAINWLSNRYGLTFNRLQKCIELDLRKQSLGTESQPQWPICPPKYNPEYYR